MYFDGVDSRVWKPVFHTLCFDSLYIAVSFSDRQVTFLTVSYTTCISMVSIEQWRAAIGGFNHYCLFFLKSRKQILESPQEASYRKEQDKLLKTRKQNLESPQEASYRKEQNKLAMTTKRILESPQEASYRKEQNKLAMTAKWILESPQEASYRKNKTS